MLQSLSIQNFALIEQIQLHFKNGFTVFTGETGSGKSIILGALNLILGERADYSVIRDENKKTIVEAQFNLKGYDLISFFDANDLDYQDETYIRREILSQGKSRAFINDSPVQLNVLKDLAERLIHIHSQHHTLHLKEQNFQFDFIDYVSGAIQIRNEYQGLFKQFNLNKRLLSEKELELTQLKKEEDYHLFQLNEIQALQLEHTNYQQIEDELNSLEHIDTIRETFHLIDFTIGSEHEVLDKIYKIRTALEKNKYLHPGLETISEQIKNVISELKEIQFESEKQLDALQNNPAKKSELEEKISSFNKILLKHHFKNQEELLVYYQQLLTQQNSNEQLSEEIEELKKQLLSQLKDLEQLNNQLQKTRLDKQQIIENQIISLLKDLKMPQTKFQFSFEDTKQFGEFGTHKLAILFSPNEGIEVKAIEKVASGGELSRLMLSMQLLLSDKKMLPTIIFDEIDTGVSGDVAQKLGELLQKMGASLQVMSITHLPQVAAKGNHHFKVSKSSSSSVTLTSVDELNAQDRISEIARLMSGENINPAAIENARVLMNL